MLMTPGLRKFALTTHVTSSVGWFGAVGAFLALAVAGVVSANADIVRGCYLAMHVTTWFVIVPFCLAALLTGIVQSLGTPWGLFRHRWVVAKLVLTVLATLILLVHTRPIGRVAALAAERTLSNSDVRQLRFQLVGDACAALFVLMVTTALSVYKPWGLTAYGVLKQGESAPTWRSLTAPPSVHWSRYATFGLLGLVFLFLLLHLAGGGLHGH
jgi:hypothetical protein